VLIMALFLYRFAKALLSQITPLRFALLDIDVAMFHVPVLKTSKLAYSFRRAVGTI
jgi:hypothetical protein